MHKSIRAEEEAEIEATTTANESRASRLSNDYIMRQAGIDEDDYSRNIRNEWFK